MSKLKVMLENLKNTNGNLGTKRGSNEPLFYCQIISLVYSFYNVKLNLM